MRVETEGGEVIDLGTTEAAPTIGITDYSRRVTDDFGVTSVVERSFSRRMSVRLAVPYTGVDALQRRLADLRGTSALWVADDRFAWLSVQGFYKDFAIDLNTAPLSYCTLTVEGLAETETVIDAGTDPAPDGRTSTLRLLQPVAITDAMLTASNVTETDYPEWSAGTTYAKTARVIKAATHRIYESAVAGNVGNDPAGVSGKWIEVSVTNRWAMFDEALGSVTSRASLIEVTIAPCTAIDAVALLDVTGSTVRVIGTGYDRMIAPTGTPGSALFLDLPAGAGSLTIRISGPGTVTVGTLLIGRLRGLGITEASPGAGITDYSRKDVDDFGEVTIVKRAWAKRMNVSALFRTDALDIVANRIAAVRARPSLWIGQEGLDSLTVHGFFKDFSIEVGEGVSKLTLSIEGLSTAVAVKPLGVDVAWPDILDPDGTKPEDNADVTIDHLPDAFASLTGRTPSEVVDDLTHATDAISLEVMRGATWRGDADQIIYTADGTPVRTVVEAIGTTVNGHETFVAFLKEVNGDGTAKFIFSARADGSIVGIEGLAGGGFNQLSFVASRFLFVDNSGLNPVQAMAYEGGAWKLKNIEAENITYGSLIPKFGGAYNQITANGGYQDMPGGLIFQWGRYRAVINDETSFSIIFPKPFPNNVMSVSATPYIATVNTDRDLWLQNLGAPSLSGASFFTQAARSADQQIDGFDWVAFGN